MKIPATLQPLLDTSRNPSPSLLKQLQVGQTLDAKVLQQIKPGLLRLQIAATELLARSQTMPPTGSRLRLLVIKGHPIPELRILRESTALERQQHTARSAMARQLSPGEVRGSVDAMRSEARSPAQAESVRQLANILRDTGVRLDQLTPTQLQRAVAQSGLFHEARLAGALSPDQADAKTRLLQLLALLGNAGTAQQKKLYPPPGGADAAAGTRDTGGDSLMGRLIRLIEASVSRIQLQQAAALPVDEGLRQAWQIDLPIQLPEETHQAMLRIEHEAAADDDGASTWAVNLVFQFDSIGTLQTRIALAGDRVSATFWSEREKTCRRIEQRLPGLKEAFEAQGLEVIHLAGVQGEPSAPLIRVPMPDSLLDERA